MCTRDSEAGGSWIYIIEHIFYILLDREGIYAATVTPAAAAI